MNRHLEIYPYLNCLEMALTLICELFNEDSIGLYINSWSFYYVKGKNIGNCIKTYNSRLQVERLTRYLKFDIQLYEGTNKISIVKKNVAEGLPVLITMDVFNCPWHKGYHKINILHACIIIDVNESGVVCIDPYLTNEKKQLCFQEFNQAIDLYTFNKTNKVKRTLDLDCFICEIKNNDYISPKAFVMMNQFANDIKHLKDVKCLMDNQNDIYLSSYFRKLKFIADDRYKMAYLFKYLSTECKDAFKENFVDPFMWCYISWQKVINLSMKAFFQNKDIASYMYRISNQIKQISAVESKLYNKILHY